MHACMHTCTHAHAHTHPFPSTPCEQVESLVTDAQDKGAEVMVGGACDDSLGPLYYKPTVLTSTNTDMRLAHEEIFGPVAPVMK